MHKRDKINKRRFLRVEFPFTLHLYIPNESPISVYTEDISEGGLKAVLKKKFPLGTEAILKVFIDSAPAACGGKIVWVKQHNSDYLDEENFFYTGIEFTDISGPDRERIREYVEKIKNIK